VITRIIYRSLWFLHSWGINGRGTVLIFPPVATLTWQKACFA
jgi:hypothetical protein